VVLNPFNAGQRYLLAMYPFLILGAGFAFYHRWHRIFRFLLPVYVGITVLNFPNYVAFFNVSSLFVKKEFLLTDTNLDWGQMNHLIAQDAKLHGKTICTRTIGLIFQSAEVEYDKNFHYPQKCVYYLSKTLKYFPQTERYFELFGEPDYHLGQVIEVHHIDSPKEVGIHFINDWEISRPFPRPADFDNGRVAHRGHRHKPFKQVHAETGVIDLRAVFPDRKLDRACVVARSVKPASGTLLLATSDKLMLFGERDVYADSEGKHYFSFYQATVHIARPRHLQVLVCNNRHRFDFAIGRLVAGGSEQRS
jgi:hypothetical protein